MNKKDSVTVFHKTANFVYPDYNAIKYAFMNLTNFSVTVFHKTVQIFVILITNIDYKICFYEFNE